MFGNMVAAADYARYADNRELINRVVAENPGSAVSVGWLATWARAQELGLNRFQASDFFGGLKGFLDSFGFDQEGVADLNYEDMDFRWDGGPTTVTIKGGLAGEGLFSVLPSAAADGRSVRIDNLADIGFAPNHPSVFGAGNDFTDLRYQGAYYVDGRDGDDIIIGSEYGDTLVGSAGFDWIDGRGGNDDLSGGAQNDVLIGGAGTDLLSGGEGDDYLALGADHDYLPGGIGGPAPGGAYGGNGRDTLIGGAGHDALFGDAGDDELIIDQDGGYEFDYVSGGEGVDVVSFERFLSGVSVDMTSNSGGGYTAVTYGDGWVAIEGIKGSQHSDQLFGDANANLLRGLDGNDSIDGRDGADTIDGGLGADTINGGAGIDLVSYQRSDEGVVVDLTTGMTLGGDATGDVLIGFEGLIGSRFADELTGSTESNNVYGQEGNDVIYISGGYDQLHGDGGFDIVDASSASTSLTLTEGQYASFNGVAARYHDVEGFIGTQFGDYMEGSTKDEYFDGAAGNDYLVGGAGSDTYRFGRGYGYDAISETNDGANSIQIAAGIDFRDILISGAGGNGDLGIYLRPTGEQIVIGANWSYGTGGIHNHKIKSLSFEGGSTVDIDSLDSTGGDPNPDGSTTATGIIGKSDLLFAYGGNDVIYTAGYAGGFENNGNVIYAGDGADSVFTSGGDDQILFERGNGVDILYDGGGDDTVIMGPSVQADDVIYEIVPTSNDANGNLRSDLIIGIRDPNNPSLSASQVADHIRIADGGTRFQDINSFTIKYTTVEYVRVGGQEIDLMKLNLPFSTFFYSTYPNGGGPIPPIAIDLDGDGIELRSAEGSRIVITDSEGGLWRMGWLGQDDGFLSLDRDGDGVITRLSEISFKDDKPGAETDLEGLEAYDSNSDGRFDNQDVRFHDFRIWQDMNQDGVGSASELRTLDEAGISFISLNGQKTGFDFSDGLDNAVVATTEIGWKDATRQGRGYDVMLATLQVRSDGGDAKTTEKFKNGQGLGGDDIDSLVHGIQGLSPEQIAMRKERSAKRASSADEVDVAGLITRIENVLEGSEKSDDGLLKASRSKLTDMLSKSGKADKDKDSFSDSIWTKAGKRSAKSFDLSVDLVKFETRDLTDSMRAEIERSKAELEKVVKDKEDRDRLLEEKQKADAANAPSGDIPSIDALEALARTDNFKLLPADSQVDVEDDVSTFGGPVAVTNVQVDFGELSDLGQNEGGEVEDSDAINSATPMRSGGTLSRSLNDDDYEIGTGAPEGMPTQNPDLDAEAYKNVVQFANARLVQALASFGDAWTMMADYQRLNVGNDPQAAWLSVDAMPSVQRFVTV